MSEQSERLGKLKSKFETMQGLPAPDISWLITHLETCYSNQVESNEDLKFTIHEVIAHLNKRSGANYRTDSVAALRHIRARYNEGYRLEDFIKVVDTKVKEWKGTQWSRYIRPSTLFARDHFEEYLQESKMAGPKEVEFSERPNI